jgi:MYXO-CTERM domain-containing protein
MIGFCFGSRLLGAFVRRLGVAGGPAVLALAASVHAQDLGERLTTDEAGNAVCIAYVGCSSDGSCPGTDSCIATAGGMACGTASGPSRDVPCCELGADPTKQCFDGAGSHGRCIAFEGSDQGFCVFDDRDVCVNADTFEISAETLGACFVGTSWGKGDCDGDGTPNQEEAPGCVCASNIDPMSPLACRPEPDAGSRVDGDGGVNGGRDAGSGEDAGPSETRDPAGPSANGYEFRGSGGCTCDSAGGGTDAAWLLVGVAVLLGRVARRRRA